MTKIKQAFRVHRVRQGLGKAQLRQVAWSSSAYRSPEKLSCGQHPPLHPPGKTCSLLKWVLFKSFFPITFVIAGELEPKKGETFLARLGLGVDEDSSAILSSPHFVRGEGMTSPHPLRTCWERHKQYLQKT